MRRKFCCVLLITVLIGISTLNGYRTLSKTTQDDLIMKRVHLQVNQGTLLQALSTLSVDEKIPIGFELALSHKNEYHLNVNADNITLQEVLDRIAEQEPAYRWEVRDGVINIIPTKSRDDFVEKLLNTPIHRFNLPKVPGKFQIRDKIVELPEVVDLLKANGVTASHYGYFYRSPNTHTDSNLSLSISNTDVRGILNKVIRESEHKMWIVSRSGDGLKSLDIGF